MTYFHIRMYTIIGAKSFHCPVRDGKEWDQLAMVVRHNWRLSAYRYPVINRLSTGRSKRILIATRFGFNLITCFTLNIIGSSRTGN